MNIGNLFGVPVDGKLLLILLGVGLIVSWLGEKVDLKALIAKFWPSTPSPLVPVTPVKTPSLGAATTNDVKLANDRLAVVLAKVDELASTRLWLQQTEDAVRKEIASVRACADAMEARLNSQAPNAVEPRS